MDGLKFVKDPNFYYDKCLLKEVIHHFSENEIHEIYQGIYNQLAENGTVLTITRNQETEYPFFLEAIEKMEANTTTSRIIYKSARNFWI